MMFFRTRVSYVPLLIIRVCRTVRQRGISIYPIVYDAVINNFYNIVLRFTLSFGIRISLVVLCCLIGLLFDCMGLLQYVFLKIGVALGGRALAFTLVKWGCSGGLTLALVFIVRVLLAEATEAMAPSGSAPVSSGALIWSVSESSSTFGRQLDRFLGEEVNSEEVGGAGSSNKPAAAPEAPAESTSSTWSGSWIGRWFRPEVAPNEGEAVSQPRGVIEQEHAGPSHQPSPNVSLESSIRNRVLKLETEQTLFLLEKDERGEYWAGIKKNLDQTSSQQEYNRILEFENRDLQLRERKRECFSLFQEVLSQHPALAERLYYKPQEAFTDFFDESTHQEWPLELQFIDRVGQDIRERGPDSIYIKKIMFLD